MKRLMTWAAALVGAMTLAGCGRSGNPAGEWEVDPDATVEAVLAYFREDPSRVPTFFNRSGAEVLEHFEEAEGRATLRKAVDGQDARLILRERGKAELTRVREGVRIVSAVDLGDPPPVPGSGSADGTSRDAGRDGTTARAVVPPPPPVSEEFRETEVLLGSWERKGGVGILRFKDPESGLGDIVMAVEVEGDRLTMHTNDWEIPLLVFRRRN